MGQPYILISATDDSELSTEWVRLAIESHANLKYVDAERQLRHALRLCPQCIPALNNIAVAYACGNDLNNALLAIERAVLISSPNPRDLGYMQANLAMIATEAGCHGVAIEAAKKAQSLSVEVPVKLAVALAFAAAGKPETAVGVYNELLATDPKHFPSGMNVCFAHTLSDWGPERLTSQQKHYYEANKYAGEKKSHHTVSLNCKPIRVGYVSGDYKRHSAQFIFGGVLMKHTPRVEAYFYSTLAVDPKVDAITKRYMDIAGDRWRDIAALDDVAAEELIRKDKIDVLVDLSAHSGGGRLPLFSRKPAPIQVHAWGFAHGSGLKEMDYFFADPVAIPEAERGCYAEKIYDLPCIVSFQPAEDCSVKGVSRAPSNVNDDGLFTFGCFCRWEKLSDACLEAINAVMLGVPDSRIIFKDDAFRRPYCVRRVLEAMKGVGRERVLFQIGTSHMDHLLSFQMCDLMLDPFPHSGGVVALEQLWCGVPLVTLYGKQAAGRTASSVLTAMGRDGWVTRTEEEYADRAVELANHRRGELAAARRTLRLELLDSPVVNGYVTAVEKAYEQMVKIAAVA